MRSNDIEAVRQLEGADGGVEREIMAQSVLGIDPEFAAVAPPEGDFVPGFYQIMPIIKRSALDSDAGYESANFRRSRHHRSVPDRVIVGMSIQRPFVLGLVEMSQEQSSL